MKPYFFTMTKMNRRANENIDKIVGVVEAAHEDEAMEKAWKLAGNDTAYNLEVQEINLTAGFMFTVYKAMI